MYPCSPHPLFWLFCMPYSRTTSHLGSTMPMYHVCTIWVGLKRPGKSESVTLLPCPHTHPHTLPFAAASLKSISPSYHILMHSPPMISYLLHYWIPATYHPPSCTPPFAFLALQLPASQGVLVLTYPHAYTIISCINIIYLTTLNASANHSSLIVKYTMIPL